MKLGELSACKSFCPSARPGRLSTIARNLLDRPRLAAHRWPECFATSLLSFRKKIRALCASKNRTTSAACAFFFQDMGVLPCRHYIAQGKVLMGSRDGGVEMADTHAPGCASAGRDRNLVLLFAIANGRNKFPPRGKFERAFFFACSGLSLLPLILLSNRNRDLKVS